MGITDHAKKNLCPLTAVELPEVGRSLSRQETFGSLEAAKAASEMFAPVSGKVVAVNTDGRCRGAALSLGEINRRVG